MDSHNLTDSSSSGIQQDLLKRISFAFESLYQVISSFEENDMNRIPFENSWTPGQVCEHIIKSISGVPQLCNGRTTLPNRPLDEKVQEFEELFLNFNLKFESPDFILPSDGPHSKTKQLSVLKETETAFIELVRTHDLSLLCLDFELPGSGLLTRYEWLRFALVHTQRHTHQLKNILNHFKQHKQ